MNTIFTFFFKIIGGLILTLIGKTSVEKDKRIFESYSKKSDFAYKLYERTYDSDLKRLSREYGIMALVGGLTLNPVQRKRILTSVDPVSDLKAYKTCKNCIEVTEQGSSLFEWRIKRYKKIDIEFLLSGSISLFMHLLFWR